MTEGGYAIFDAVSLNRIGSRPAGPAAALPLSFLRVCNTIEGEISTSEIDSRVLNGNSMKTYSKY